jgi:hypothetical protein
LKFYQTEEVAEGRLLKGLLYLEEAAEVGLRTLVFLLVALEMFLH